MEKEYPIDIAQITELAKTFSDIKKKNDDVNLNALIAAFSHIGATELVKNFKKYGLPNTIMITPDIFDTLAPTLRKIVPYVVCGNTSLGIKYLYFFWNEDFTAFNISNTC